MKFPLIIRIFREINFLVTSLVKSLGSRKKYGKMKKLLSHTVLAFNKTFRQTIAKYAIFTQILHCKNQTF